MWLPPAHGGSGSEPAGSGQATKDLFDSARQGKQLTASCRIELEPEWKAFRVQCHRDADTRRSEAIGWL